MAIQSQPSRIPQPFAGAGTKNTIPATNATPSASQAASWASGFPPECSQPISAGGCPVPRNDVNGVLSQLSQDYAFRQDGGIWEWSALADYDTQRMVRGSDGLLYWSVQPSGPGLATGAVDPSTDDGTYWSSPALKTVSLADKSDLGATTEWVKELAIAPVYLDPAGSDGNDGLTAATAVQTFAKAIEVGGGLSAQSIKIIAAGGSYTGDVSVAGQKKILLTLGADTTITGSVAILEQSAIRILGAYTLTVVASSTANAIKVDEASSLLAENTDIVLTVTGLSDYAISVKNSSSLYTKTITIGGSSCAGGIVCQRISNIKTNGKITIANILSAGHSFWVDFLSSFIIESGGFTVHSSTSSEPIFVASLSFFESKNLGEVYNHCGSTACMVAIYFGEMWFSGGIKLISSNSTACISSLFKSFVQINTIMNLSGTVSYCTVNAFALSNIVISNTTAVSGSVSGTRYIVDQCSVIDTGGGGANRIPGTVAGIAFAERFSLYI